MNSKIKILFLFVLAVTFFNGYAQEIINNNQAHLFTDRDYCISGDSLWFKVWLPETLEEKSNIVRIQLDTNNGNLISSIAKRSKDGWAQGFIHVPDSLSSGLCFVTAFLNNQRDSVSKEILSSALYVYNRFEESITELIVTNKELKEDIIDLREEVNFSIDKLKYETREKVNFRVNYNSEEISKAIVKARLIDPFSNEYSGIYRFRSKSSNESIPVFSEKDGLIISGKVYNSEKKPQHRALVVMSITDDPPYFDYSITGKEGDFHFYLQDAVGNAPVVIQNITQNDQEFFIETESNSLSRFQENKYEAKLLTPEQSGFISTIINGNFIKKIFNPPYTSKQPTFTMPIKYDIPFYGPPTKRVIPDEYFDLPDFKEISREILPGVQYRERNGLLTFRLLNDTRNVFFDNEPLRLLNGIPVFKNSLFASLKSTDIKYIDLIKSERIYGDLQFKGILAVALYDESNAWMAQQPNIYQFNIPCLQPDANPGYLVKKELNASVPDTRQIFLWTILDVNGQQDFQFQLSDIKGKVEITVEGVSKSQKPFKTSKIIEVK